MLIELLKSQFREIPSIVVVDIGAMIEGTPRYAPLVRHGCATVVGFEPQATELLKLRAIAPSTHIYMPYMLGQGGPAKFYRTRYPGCSSLYEPDPSIIDLFSTIGAAQPGGNFFVEESINVETKRLDEIPEMPRPDCVKLDVQGAELDVLVGGADTVSSALIVEVETEFVPMYRQQPLYGDIDSFLRKQGFQFHKFIDVGGRSFAPMLLAQSPYVPISQLLWADSVFVRDFSNLPNFSNEDLLKASIILDEVYRSFDLAAFLLLELDKRGGGNLGASYIAALKQTPLTTMLLNIRDTP